MTTIVDELKAFKKEIRQSIADYISSEGCGCCEDREAHKGHAERLAKLLNVKKYSDKSGYDFSKYKSKQK